MTILRPGRRSGSTGLPRPKPGPIPAGPGLVLRRNRLAHKPISTKPRRRGVAGASVSAAVGGQGVLWTNNCPRPTPAERGELLSDDEWEHYLGAAERYLGVTDDTFSGSVRQQRILERLGPVLAAAGRDLRGQPMAGRPWLPTPSTTSPPMTSWPASGADRDRRRTPRSVPPWARFGVRLADGATVPASAVVLAAEPSTPDPAAPLGNSAPGPGCRLTYHPVLYSQLVLDPDLCGGAGDVPPRLWIPPAPAAPWNTMLLRDTNPVPPSAPMLICLHTGCSRSRRSARSTSTRTTR